MRTFTFILALATVMVGPSLAGSSDGGVPGIGTFSYNTVPVVSNAPLSMVVAAR